MVSVEQIKPMSQYTIREVCEALGISRKTLDRRVEDNIIPKYWHKMTGKPFFKGKDIIKYAQDLMG